MPKRAASAARHRAVPRWKMAVPPARSTASVSDGRGVEGGTPPEFGPQKTSSNPLGTIGGSSGGFTIAGYKPRDSNRQRDPPSHPGRVLATHCNH
jgi:hypothetical protein